MARGTSGVAAREVDAAIKLAPEGRGVPLSRGGPDKLLRAKAAFPDRALRGERERRGS
jgi:hypothetical protein